MKSWMNLLILLNLLLAGCGSDKPVAEDPQAPASPAPGGSTPAPSGEKISYQDMQGFMNQYCKGCHASDSFIQSEAGLKSSKAQTRLSNKTMPPSFAPKQLPDNIRTQMLSYF